MLWRGFKEKKKKKKKPSAMYERLGASADCMEEEDKVPKGHVPVLVGGDDAAALERFVVPLGLLQHPCMATLLDMGAQEFGYRHQGILRIPCDVHHFRRILGAIGKTR